MNTNNFPGAEYEPYVEVLGDATTFSTDVPIKKGSVVGRVVGIVSETETTAYSGTQRVLVDTAWGNAGGEPIEATVLSPYADETGKGLIFGIKKGARCVVQSAGLNSGGVPQYFVTGFYQTQPKNLENKNVMTGDIHLRSENNGKISMFSSGDILVEANEKCFTMWDPEESDVTTEVRASYHSTFAGKETWEHSKAEDTKDETLRTIKVNRKISATHGIQYVEQQGHLKAEDDSDVTSRRRAYESAGFDKDDPTSSVTFMEEIAEDGSYTIQVADKATVTIDASNGTVSIEIPDKAIFSMDGDDKAITIEQANSGASVRLDKDGNVYVTPGGGKNVHLNDSGGTAQGVCRIGDATSGHMHSLGGTAGPFGLSGTAVTTTDTMSGGSSFVKSG